jgi:hypothetical protein
MSKVTHLESANSGLRKILHKRNTEIYRLQVIVRQLAEQIGWTDAQIDDVLYIGDLNKEEGNTE